MTTPTFPSLADAEQGLVGAARPQAPFAPAAALMLSLVAGSLGCFGIAGHLAAAYPQILTSAVLAFVLGLRHALDADHIAAIDNVTRRLVLKGQRPISVGFWFSLGHCTVVNCISAGVAIGAQTDAFKGASAQASHVVATAVSATFLLGIGALNVAAARQLYAQYRCGTCEEAPVGGLLQYFPSVQRLLEQIDAPVKIFPVGLLFGLGFDTATQVGLLGLTAQLSARGQLPAVVVMLFPALFTIGMTLTDTADGLLMLYAYAWGAVQPERRLRYNLLVTGLSGMVALVVGAVETLQLAAASLHWDGPVGRALESINLGALGIGIIGLFGGLFATFACAAKLQALRSESRTACAAPRG